MLNFHVAVFQNRKFWTQGPQNLEGCAVIDALKHKGILNFSMDANWYTSLYIYIYYIHIILYNCKILEGVRPKTQLEYTEIDFKGHIPSLCYYC